MLKNRQFTSGYDSEELYFEKLNRELIQKLKTEGGADQKSSQTASSESKGAQVIAFPTRQKETHKKAA